MHIYLLKEFHFVISHLPPSQGGKFTGFGNPACKFFLYVYVYVYIYTYSCI